MEQLSKQRRNQLERFFTEYESQAFHMALALTRNRDDALEMVQDSMLKLVQHYAAKPSGEWHLLFFRILQNRIRDFHRRQKLQRLFTIFQHEENDNQADQLAFDKQQDNPQQLLEQSNSLKQINHALETLPMRQQQTFLLRAWQEFTVKETAFALSISEGSVKTHYSRALTQMRKLLGEAL